MLLLPSSWLFVERPEDGHASHEAGSGAGYACPMFCVVMDEMPEDGRCPVCGMDVTEISVESRLSAEERRMVGLEVSRVRRIPLSRTVRVVGEVDYDETRLSRITTRMSGWLEKVWVTTTWERVSAGDKLRQSGEVQQALVLRAPSRGVVVERRAIEGNAVDKGAVLYSIADLSRVWIQSEVFERDLPWVRVGQSASLEVESRAEPLEGRISFIDPVIDRRTRTARVRIEVANPEEADGTRSLRIGQRVDAWMRARLGPDGALLPAGEEPAEQPLAVPRSAVLRTGERAVVYLLFTETADGSRDLDLDPDALPETVYYELVEVKPGPLSRDEAGNEYYPLRSAPELPEGALVVSKGNLLLDSQAQLSGRPSLLFPEGNRGGGGAHDHSGH